MVHGYMWVPLQKISRKKNCDFWQNGDLCIPNFVAIHVANISNNAKVNRSNNHNIIDKQICISCLLKWVKIQTFLIPFICQKLNKKNITSSFWSSVVFLFVNKCIWIIRLLISLAQFKFIVVIVPKNVLNVFFVHSPNSCSSKSSIIVTFKFVYNLIIINPIIYIIIG